MPRLGRLISPGSGSDRALRDEFSIGHVPGNKLPGYDHRVPPGQNLVVWLKLTLMWAKAPGYDNGRRCALEGRPNKIPRVLVASVTIQDLSAMCGEVTAAVYVQPFRSPLQGESLEPNPGLKPWAILFSHFVAFDPSPRHIISVRLFPSLPSLASVKKSSIRSLRFSRI